MRIGRRDVDGRYHNVYVVPNKPEPWRILFEKAVSPEEAELIVRSLTASQREYVRKAYEVVSADIEAGSENARSRRTGSTGSRCGILQDGSELKRVTFANLF